MTVGNARITCFNSCPHAEGNLPNQHWAFTYGVSIRALTRRATLRGRQFKLSLQSFNSCPHAEGNFSSFRFPLPQDFRFNSCPHAEGNTLQEFCLPRLLVSIRALTRRATV